MAEMITCNRLILPHDVNGGRIWIPREIAVCPYCAEACSEQWPLIARMMAWELSGKRRGVEIWKCSEFELECMSEPNLEDDIEAWESWIEFHSYMPYVYMLPIEIRVSKWINSVYRFVMDQ